MLSKLLSSPDNVEKDINEYNDKLFLIDTIKNEQDIFENVCNELLKFET